MVTVFGLGFVGLTTALGFAYQGVKVFGIEINEDRYAQLSRGSVLFHEPYLESVLSKTLGNSFFISDNINMAVKESQYIFFCVGTPYGDEGAADLSYLFNAIDNAMDAMDAIDDDDAYKVFIIKSTVPPSTTSEKIWPYIMDKKRNIGLANNPEFLREGHCWNDFINADRIVLGCNDEKTRDMLTDLYKPFNAPIIYVSQNTSEFIKYLSNTLLANMISFSNEMSIIADYIGGIDIKTAFKTLHMDKRWNGCDMTSYVYPGCGYGGYCLPKDTNALLAQSMQKGYTPKILQHVIELNDNMSVLIAKKISQEVCKHERIGILGLSFKPGSDDVRDSPAAKIISTLLEMGYCHIIAHDPIAITEFQRNYNYNIEYQSEIQKLNADILVITTAWEEYKTLRGKIIDCRYCLH